MISLIDVADMLSKSFKDLMATRKFKTVKQLN